MSIQSIKTIKFVNPINHNNQICQSKQSKQSNFSIQSFKTIKFVNPIIQNNQICQFNQSKQSNFSIQSIKAIKSVALSYFSKKKQKIYFSCLSKMPPTTKKEVFITSNMLIGRYQMQQPKEKKKICTHFNNFSTKNASPQDHGIPEKVGPFLEFIELADNYNTQNRSLLIHCSAGVGRTGVFIAVHSILTKLRKLEGQKKKKSSSWFFLGPFFFFSRSFSLRFASLLFNERAAKRTKLKNRQSNQHNQN